MDRRLHYATLAAILTCGVVLRTIHLGVPALSGDEYFDTFAARSWLTSGTFQIPGRAAYLRGLPMILATAFSFSTFGESEWSARLPALLFGIATLPLTYAAGRMFFGRGAALVATALLAFSPHGVDVSRYARLYALLTFLVLACAMATYRALEGTGEEGPRLTAGRFTFYAVAAICGLLAITLHPVIVSLGVAFQAYVTCMAAAAVVHRDREAAARYGGIAGALLLGEVAAFMVPALRDRMLQAALQPLPWYKPSPGQNWIAYDHLASQYGLTWYAAIPATLLVLGHFRRRGLFVALSFWLPFLFISIVVATKHYRYIFQLLPLLWLTLGGAAQVLVEQLRAVREAWRSRRFSWSNAALAGAGLVLVVAVVAGFGRALITAVRRPWQPTGTFTTGYYYDWRSLRRDLGPVLPLDAYVVSDMSYSTIYYLQRPSLHLIGSHRQVGVGDWENPDPDESRYVLDVDRLISARSQRAVWVIATSGRWRQGFFRPSLTTYVETACERVPTTATFVVVFNCRPSPHSGAQSKM
jgi:4-amino-4-deoxy-L-arabinose transferase-like glycosyltransferase